jgi:hypothetical protein
MGTACFCGCGRKIPLRNLVRRSHNNLGHDVVKAIASCHDELATTGRPPDDGERQWLEEGDDVLDVVTRATHGELRRPNLSNIAAWLKKVGYRSIDLPGRAVRAYVSTARRG